MRATNSEAEWGWVGRLLHWTIAALVLLQFGIAAYILGADDLARRFAATQTHKSWGAVIFGLALARVAWRLANRAAPGMPPGMPRWERRAARASHITLYALLVVVPLSGWVYASAAPLQTLMGIENEVFGWFALPDPWPVGREAVSDAAFAVHWLAALVLLLVAVAHAAAALKHHFVDRDDVLSRMTVPRRRSGG